MRCTLIVTYFDGSHEPPFYLLTESDRNLLHALDVIKTSKEIDYFEVDYENGQDFYDRLFQKIYSGMTIEREQSK